MLQPGQGYWGGGEVLQYWGNGVNYNYNSPYLNNSLIRMFQAIPFVKILIILLIIFLMVRVLMALFNIRSFRSGRGIVKELGYIDKVRKRDASILRYNKLIQRVTQLIEASPFVMSKTGTEYWEYNLERANIRIPGGSRVYKPQEFHAVVTAIELAVCAVSLIILVLFNYSLGIVLMVMTIISAHFIPMQCLRTIVAAKDDEIKKEFADFYLMLHHTLLSHAGTPLTTVMKSYAKTTDSKEMEHLVDVCVHYFDTYGEYEGTKYVSRAYREIPSMGKLMRLIRQNNEGGDIEAELIGFRTELIAEKRYAIEKYTDKLVNRARASFNLLMPILIQAILSAMSIYISDMGLAGSVLSF